MSIESNFTDSSDLEEGYSTQLGESTFCERRFDHCISPVASFCRRHEGRCPSGRCNWNQPPQWNQPQTSHWCPSGFSESSPACSIGRWPQRRLYRRQRASSPASTAIPAPRWRPRHTRSLSGSERHWSHHHQRRCQRERNSSTIEQESTKRLRRQQTSSLSVD